MDIFNSNLYLKIFFLTEHISYLYLFPLALKITILKMLMCLLIFYFILYIKLFENYDTNITTNKSPVGEV